MHFAIPLSYMKKLFLILLITCLFSKIFSQINLVPNSSFEDTSSCPQMQGFTFHSYTPPWFSPNGGTPNIYNTCANISSGVSVPSPSTYEYQWPRTGNGYASFAWCYSSNCEFLSVKLNNKLIAGKNYCVSFFVNPFYYCYFLIDKIGAYISTDSIQYSSYGYLNYIPQIENTSGNVITDTLNWTEISGQFTAIGGEQYINIGVFRPDSLVQFVYVDSTVVGFCPFYYLDDVSVYLCDDKVPAEAGSSQTICKRDSVHIGTVPRTEYIYYWQPAIGLSNANIANPKASPNTTTTYYLQQTDFLGDITIDSVTIIVNNCEDTIKDDIFIPNIFSPNGDLNNDVFYVCSHTIAEMTFCIYNRWGEKVFESREINKGWDGTYKNEKCNTGVFVYYLEATLVDGRKVERQGNVTLVR